MKVPLRKIMCVEDDTDIQVVARLTLETLGRYTVTVCNSGSDAVKVAAEFKPDLILLDVTMPGLDGPETLKIIKAIPELADIPIVFLTARVLPQEISSYLEMGAFDVIPKPFDPVLLPSLLENVWLNNKNTANEAVASQIKILQQAYISQLPDKIQQIFDAWSMKSGDENTKLKALQNLVHRLAGSGGTYGFMALSDTAKRLDICLIAHLQSPLPLPDEEIRKINDSLESLRKEAEKICRLEQDTGELRIQ